MPKNYKSHKRQKSSVSNTGYYFNDPPQSQSNSSAGPPSNMMLQQSNLQPGLQSQLQPQQYNNMAPDQQLMPLAPDPINESPTHSNPQSVTSPNIDSLYESDIYNPLNYNFPPERPSTLFYPVNQNLASSSYMDSYPLASGGNLSGSAQSSGNVSGMPVMPPMASSHSAPAASFHTTSTVAAGSGSGHGPSYLPPPHSSYSLPLAQQSHSLISQSHSSQSLHSQLQQTPHTPRTTSQRSSPVRRPKSHSRTHSRTHSHSTPKSMIIPKPALAIPRHKQNLSISSHFNLFSLNESDNFEFDQNAVLNDLLYNLIDVDQASVNNFLLNSLNKLNFPIPLDDFYNLLYHNNKQITLNTQNKLDKTKVDSEYSQSCMRILYQVLEIFKEPESIKEFLDSHHLVKEIKLSNINYHELLRTFLALKILQDMLIELPRSSTTDITAFNIPRLSLYKTYYIICQKLLLKYPSSIAANNDHHKLILGQSKLGKLIKLVYPNLLIKRLGSRGESKYNYLGVVWNENVVDQEVIQLCDNYELIDLNQVFDSKYKSNLVKSYDMEAGSSGDFNAGSGGVKQSNTGSMLNIRDPPGSISSSNRANRAEQTIQTPSGSSGQQYLQSGLQTSFPSYQPFDFKAESLDLEFNKSVYSFLNNPNLKFPETFDLMSWINSVKYQAYQSMNYPIERIVNELITEISNTSLPPRHDSGFSEDSVAISVVSTISEHVLSHSDASDSDQPAQQHNKAVGKILMNKLSAVNFNMNDSNNDLKVYFLILLEVLPYLLLLKPTNDLKLLKSNLKNFLNDQSDLFTSTSPGSKSQNNLINFKLILKNLLNLNDLLVNITKVIFNDSSILNNLLTTFTNSTPNDNIMNNLIDNLIVFTSPGSLNYSFINNQITNLKNWFLVDLTNFFSQLNMDQVQSTPTQTLSDFEISNAINWLNLLNNLLTNFNSFPIILFINFFNLVSNDLMKANYLSSSPNFNHYWILNCFIQDYLNLIGELFGLYNEISS